MSDYSKIAYEFYKRNKICTSCRKRKVYSNITTCEHCRLLKKISYENRKAKEKNISSYKFQPKVCYVCGVQTIARNTLCDKCYEEVVIPEFIRGKRECQTKKLITDISN